MDKKIFALVLPLCLTLCGCASLLERSYSSVESYTDRYWDSGVEDTLKAESYQDLVNSLLMLIEQRSDEVIIRYYAPDGTDAYAQAVRAKHEVQNETILGSYLLESLTLTYSGGDGYSTLIYSMTYRTDAQDISSLMALSDSQSLVDLLRLAVREGHESLTAQFITRVSREEVEEVVNQLWQELYLDELEASGALTPSPTEDETTDQTPSDTENEPSGESGTEAENEPDTGENTGTEPEENSEDPNTGENDENGENSPGDLPPELPPEPIIEFPPCPWTIVFYPDLENAEIVEILLK